MNHSLRIRPATLQDMPEIIQLCQEHARFEDADYDPTNKLESLSEYLFQTEEVVQCLVAVQENKIIGYATFMKQFSTWDAEFYIYLDCLYFRKEARGQGAGRTMMNRVKEYAKEENCSLIQWQTPSSNDRAIIFYHNLGATSKDKMRFFWEI